MDVSDRTSGPYMISTTTLGAPIIGTIEPHHHAIIENLLIGKGIAAPIATSEYFEEDTRRIVSQFDQSARLTIQRFRIRFSIKEDIRFCFVGSLEENAFAAYSSEAPDVYFIVILVGIVLSGRRLETILRNPKTRHLLGLPEIVPSEDNSENLPALTGIAFDWLVYHELGHIKNGHLRLRPAVAFGAMSTEKMERDNATDRNLTIHALEMDADCIASSEMMVSLLEFDASKSPQLSILSNAQQKASAFFISIYSIMRAFDRDDWSIEQIYNFTHPPAAIRMYGIANWGIAWFAKFSKSEIDPEWWAENSVSCILAVEDAISSPREQYLKILEVVESKANVDYTRRLLGRWAKIRPGLAPHLLGGNLVAAQAEPL